MRKRTLFLSLLFALAAAPAFAGGFEGPLIVKNGQPLYAALNSPSLVSAEPESFLNLNFSYSSTYLVEASSAWFTGLDLETAMLDIQDKRTVGDGLEIGFDLPVIRYGSGFFDNEIESYHSLIGMPNAYGRKNRPQNNFLLSVTHDGKAVVHGTANETTLGDLMLETKKNIFHDDSSSVSLQAFINLPTGDPQRSSGSGRTNGGIAVLVNERLRSDVMLYVNAGLGLLHELTAIEYVELKNYYYGGAGLEWIFSPKVLLNVQTTIQSSPFPKMKINAMDNPSMLGSFGGRYLLGEKSTLGLSVTEDIDVAGAPDIMMGFDYRHRF